MLNIEAEQKLPQAWALRTRVSAGLKGDFLDTIAQKINEAGADGELSLRVDLPPRYRSDTKRGRKLRNAMVAAVNEAGFTIDIKTEEGSWWSDSAEWNQQPEIFGDSDDGYVSPNDKLLGTGRRRGRTLKRQDPKPGYVIISSEKRN